MGYQEALEAAGAIVLDFTKFGSYQGDWWAVVDYQGKRGWVNGSYGSCSGCDAFESEFGWHDEDNQEKLAAFGKNYLDSLMNQDEAIKEASRYIEWDTDAQEMVAHIQKLGLQHDVAGSPLDPDTQRLIALTA